MPNLDQEINEKIDAHWRYIESILVFHKVQNAIEIAEIGYREGFKAGLKGLSYSMPLITSRVYKFHYETAHKHGRKHREKRIFGACDNCGHIETIIIEESGIASRICSHCGVHR